MQAVKTIALVMLVFLADVMGGCGKRPTPSNEPRENRGNNQNASQLQASPESRI